MDTLDVLALLVRVLPLALPAPVHCDLAIALHLELDRAILAKQASTCLRPLVVTEGVAGHID